jgi:hypothetical protein
MFGMCDCEMSLQEFAAREGGSMVKIDDESKTLDGLRMKSKPPIGRFISPNLRDGKELAFPACVVYRWFVS